MRLFVNQTNLIETTPVLDHTGTPEENATITVRVLSLADEEIASSEIVLEHVAGGIYRKTMPVIAIVVGTQYYLEVEVEVEGNNVWYLKQPFNAIVRSSQPDA